MIRKRKRSPKSKPKKRQRNKLKRTKLRVRRSPKRLLKPRNPFTRLSMASLLTTPGGSLRRKWLRLLRIAL